MGFIESGKSKIFKSLQWIQIHSTFMMKPYLHTEISVTNGFTPLKTRLPQLKKKTRKKTSYFVHDFTNVWVVEITNVILKE